ncbi:glutathione S-transferase family protein [Budvicia diplopodorum]|uniref:glutathione S-transferase family protein n=1 Tax=Budvicia diplopodorum TaxID=1119056 RepID=UPI00135AE992|nr:glutathione S-transferase family protein [Budvicia diplopodorum]
MYQLYIANKNYSSWSLRPWVLMKTLAIPFEEIMTPFTPVSSWNEFSAFSPSGKVPCLTHTQLTIWDSLAIIEYLAESHASVWPASAEARAWARCASAEMHSGFNTIRSHCPMNIGIRLRLSQQTPELKKELSRLDGLWNQSLDKFGGPFLAGDIFTAVDAFFAPVAFRLQSYDLTLSPTALAYADRLRNLPAMVQWQQAALKEVWREEDHERESLDRGTLLQDLRTG